MRLTKKQKEALSDAPLHFGQCEINLNRFYWLSDDGEREYLDRTVQSLIDKGLLIKDSTSWITAFKPIDNEE